MKLDTTFENIEKTVSLCIRDGMCTYSEWPECDILCSIYSHHRVYTASAGGLVYLVRALLEGRIDYTPTIVEYAFQCPLCEACDMCEIIPVPKPHLGPSEVIRLLKHQLVKHDLIPEEIKKEVQRALHEPSDPVSPPTLNIPERIKDDAASTVFFVGPINSENDKKFYESAFRLLEKIGMTVSIYHENKDVSGLYDLGFWDELGEILFKRMEKMKALDTKEVLFLDPHSQEFYARRYAGIIPDGPKIKSRHFTEIMVDALKDGKLKPKKQNIKVSYHDPCRLSRGLKIYDSIRDLMSFFGLEVIEMKRNRENTYCCGAGGRYQAFPDYARHVALERMEEFDHTGADLLITACQYCKAAFDNAGSKNAKSHIKDLIQFVEENTE